MRIYRPGGILEIGRWHWYTQEADTSIDWSCISTELWMICITCAAKRHEESPNTCATFFVCSTGLDFSDVSASSTAIRLGPGISLFHKSATSLDKGTVRGSSRRTE